MRGQREQNDSGDADLNGEQPAVHTRSLLGVASMLWGSLAESGWQPEQANTRIEARDQTAQGHWSDQSGANQRRALRNVPNYLVDATPRSPKPGPPTNFFFV